MNRFVALLAAAFTIAVSCGPLNAAVVFKHLGKADPTAEGWSTLGFGSPTNVGPVTESGVDAWFVDDNGSALGDGGIYTATPTAAQIAAGNTLGWTLRTRMRVVDSPDSPGGSPLVLYRDGTTSWQMHFGSESDGDPIVHLFDNGTTAHGGPSFTLQESGGGYHLYELVYDPVAGSADLFVDGSEVISDWFGFAFGGTLVGWGAGSSHDVGQGNFNLVEWEVHSNPIPEPASFALWAGLGVLSVFVLRRRWAYGS